MELPHVVGFFMHHNTNYDGSNFTWKCVQRDTNQWAFHRKVCDDYISIHKECCKQCWDKRHDLYKMCRAEIALRQLSKDDITAKGRIQLMKIKSPYIVVP